MLQQEVGAAAVRSSVGLQEEVAWCLHVAVAATAVLFLHPPHSPVSQRGGSVERGGRAALDGKGALLPVEKEGVSVERELFLPVRREGCLRWEGSLLHLSGE